MSKPSFDPTKPYEVLDVKTKKIEKITPEPKKEITKEEILSMIRAEIRIAISNQRPVERIIEHKTIERVVPKEGMKIIKEEKVLDEEAKKSIQKAHDEIEKVKHSINFIIPARFRSKERYEVTNVDVRRRSFDVTSSTVDELYQVLGTLLADLKAAKIIQ